MKYDEPKGDWFSLPKPWLELRQALRDKVAMKAGEIHTYDGGRLEKIDGRWEVIESGDHHDAEVVRNALRKPKLDKPSTDVANHLTASEFARLDEVAA